MKPSIKQLEELAGKASPGPWKANTAVLHKGRHMVYKEPLDFITEALPPDAQFIAAANPTVALNLIADWKAMREALDLISYYPPTLS